MNNYLISKNIIPNEYKHVIKPNTKYETAGEYKNIKDEILIRIYVKHVTYQRLLPKKLFITIQELRQNKISKIL